MKMRVIGRYQECATLPFFPREGTLQQKPESHYFLGFAPGEVKAAFLPDACAIKGKQLTGTAACLARLVCGLAVNMQHRKKVLC